MIKEYTGEEKIVGLILIVSILLLFTDNISRLVCGIWLGLGIYYIIKNKKYNCKGLEGYFLIYIFSQAISLIWAKELKVSWNEFYRHMFAMLPLFTITQINCLNKIKHKVLDISITLLTVYYFIYINLQFLEIVPSLAKDGLRYIGFGNGTVVKYAFIIGVQCIYMCFKVLKNEKYRFIYIVGLIMNLYLLILSGARGAWLGIIAALLLMSFSYIKDRKKIGFGGVLFGGLLSLIYILKDKIDYFKYLVKRFSSISNTKSDGSNVARMKMWDVSVQKFKETNYLGLGYKNNLKYPALGISFDHPHSDYFYILSSSGIIGIFGYLYFLVMVFLRSLKNVNRDIWLFILGLVSFLAVYGVVEVLIQTFITLTVTVMMLSFADSREGYNE